MKLYKRDGTAVEVPDDQIQSALSTGQFGAPADAQIPVVMDGQVGSVPYGEGGKDFFKAIQAGGQVTSQQALEEAKRQAYLEKEYGGVGGAAAAAGIGFADTATLGAAPFVAGAVGGPGARRYMREVEEAHPTASTVGNVAGVAVPLALDVATAGGATPLVAGSVGRAGARGVELAEGAGALARGAEVAEASRALPLASRGLEATTAGRALPAAERLLPAAPEAEALITGAQTPIAKGISAAGPLDTLAQSPVAKAAQTLEAAAEPAGKHVARAVADTAVESAAKADPGLMSQIGSYAVKGVIAPQRAVSEIGSYVEKGIQSLIGTEAESVLGRTVQKGVALAGRGAAEGSLYGAGDYLSQQSRQENPNFEAEKLLSSMWRGAKFGGAGSAALGSAVSLIGAGVRRAAPGMLDRANSLMFKALDHSGGLEQEFAAKFGDEAVNKLREHLIDSGVLTAGSRIDEIAPRLADQASIARNAYFDEFLPRVANDAMPELRVKDVEAFLNKEFPKSKLSALDGKAGRPDVEGLIQNLKDQVLERAVARAEKLGVKPPPGQTLHEALRKAQKLADSSLTFHEAIGVSRELEALSMKAGAAESKNLRHVQSYFDDHIGKSLPDNLSTSNKQLSERYKQLSMASRYASESAGAFHADVRRAADRAGEAGITGLPKGVEQAAIAFGGGHALGHGISGLAVGWAAKTAKKILAERGASAAAVALDEVALRAGAVHAGDAVQRKIDRAIAGVFKRETAGLEAPGLGKMTYEERVDRLVAAAHSAESATGQVASDLSRAGMKDARVAQAFKAGYGRTVQYLLGEVPKPPSDPNSLQPELQQKDWEPSEGDKMAFNRKYDVATHPEVYAKRVADGTVTPSETEALKATHPATQDYIVQQLKGKAGKEKKVILPTTETTIRRIEGVPLVNPRTMAAFGRKPGGSADKQSGGAARSALKIDPGAVGLTGSGKSSKY